MPTNNQSPWLPANHRKPSRAELQAQYAREEEASALGKIKAQKKLQEQKLGMDYSRSQAGSVILDKALETASAAIDDIFELTTKRAGNSSALIGPVYKQLKQTPLVNLPKFRDGEVVLDDNGEQVPAFTTERHTCLWDSDDIAFITLLTLLDVVRMPLLGSIEKQSKQGKRDGTRPDVYGLHALIAGLINDHLCHTYIRRCTRGTGKDQLLDFILSDAYDNKAG